MTRTTATISGVAVFLGLACVFYVAFVKDRVHEVAGGADESPKLFSKWVDIYTTTAVPSQALKARGVTLAKQRGVELRSLMEKDPERALSYGIPAVTQAKLPAEVREHLEGWKSGHATVVVLAAYNNDNQTAYFHHIEFTDGSKYAGFVYGRRYAEVVKEPVPMWGMVLGDSIIVHSDPVRTMTEEESLSHDMPVANSDMVDPVTNAVATRSVGAEIGGVAYHFADQSSRATFVTRQTMEERSRMATRGVQTNKPKGQTLNVIVLILQFADETSAVTTVASFTTYFNHIRKFWVENSYGCTDMQASFTPIIKLSGTRASYGGTSCPISSSGAASSAMDDEAWSKATALGYSESAYDRYVLVFSSFSTCTWLGLASVAATQAWINGAVNPSSDWHVYAHEFGHNYGLRHANSWVTTTGGAPINGNAGHTNSYYDDYDVMGGTAIVADLTNFHVNNNKKYDLTWIPTSELYSVLTTDCTSQLCNYRIFAMDRPDSIPSRAVRVQTKTTRWYWLEVRQMIDYAPAAAYWSNGIVVHQIDDTTTYNDESNLLDLTSNYVDDNPWSTALENAPLQIGASFVDTTYSMSIVPTFRGVTSRGIQYMDVAISRTLQTATISASGGITVNCATAGAGNSIRFSVAATHSASRAMNYFWQFGDQLYATTNSPVVTHAYAVAGSYSANVTVSDNYGVSQLIPAVSVTVDSSSCGCTATCNSRGTCAGAVCVCNYNSTGTTCTTDLKVSTVTPAFSATYTPASVTVATTAAVFTIGSTTALCSFRPHGVVAATVVDTQTVTCTPPSIAYAPYNSGSLKWGVEVEVSPNGVEWSQTRVVFTYGATGSCSPVCVNGNCDTATSTCTCNAGFSGSTCATTLSVATITPSFGGMIGGTPISITGSNIFGSGGCNDVLIRYTGANFTAYTSGMVNAAGSIIWATTPAANAAISVKVDVSPNRGVDWTAVGATNFDYKPVVQLFDGLTHTQATVAANGLDFYQYFHGDEGVQLTITLTAVSGAAPELYIGKGQQPFATAGACVTSLYQDCASLTKTYAAGSAYVGVYYIGVGGAALATATYTLKVQSSPSATVAVKLTADATGPVNGYIAAAGTTNVFALSHGGDLQATQLYIWAGTSTAFSTASTLTMGYKLNGGVTLTPATSDKQGTLLALQACATTGTYNVAVQGPGIYFLKASKLSAATAYQPLTLTSSLSTITVSWLDAIPATGTSVSDFTYSVYYKQGSTLSEMNTPCKAEANSKAGDDVTPAAKNSVTISSLAPITSYVVTVVVTDKRGVKAVYTPASVSTFPSEVPTSTLIIIGAVVGGVLVAGGILLAIYRKCRSHKKKKHPKKQVALLTVKAKAKASFKPAAKGELRFKKDEILILIGHPTKQGWILARNRQKEQGLVPFAYFRVQKDQAAKYKHHANRR